MKAITNAKIIIPDTQGNFFVQENYAILFNETIKKILPSEEIFAEEIFDAKGKYVSPGFINIHIHGCGGKDTMDEEIDALPVMSKLLTKMGVTSYLPTTMTYDIPKIHRAFARVRKIMNQPVEGAKILGCHMEGPFISAKYKGAQAEKNICKADYKFISDFEDVIKIITFAPEELDDKNFIKNCQAAGIIFSIGHSAATYELAMKFVEDYGVKHFTHLFNAMTNFHHRKPGIVGAALDTDSICEIISDNIHVSPAAQRIAYHAKQGKNIILITDSMRACGIGDGISELGGQKVFVKGALATLEDGTLVGSVIEMNRAVKNFWQNTKISLPEVVELVTKNPAKELNLYKKIGSIEVGKQADFTIFDEELNTCASFVDGKIFYAN